MALEMSELRFAAVPPDVRKWLSPSGKDALSFLGCAPVSGSKSKAIWLNFGKFFARQVAGAQPRKKVGLFTEGHSRFRTSGGIAAKKGDPKLRALLR